MDRRNCGECRAAFAQSRWDTPADLERKKHGPPCSTCRPQVLRPNALVLEVWRMSQGQMIIGPSGPVDLDIQAIKMVMDMLGVHRQLICMQRVQIMAWEMFRAQAEKREQEREKAKSASAAKTPPRKGQLR